MYIYIYRYIYKTWQVHWIVTAKFIRLFVCAKISGAALIALIDSTVAEVHIHIKRVLSN